MPATIPSQYEATLIQYIRWVLLLWPWVDKDVLPKTFPTALPRSVLWAAVLKDCLFHFHFNI